MDTMDSMATMYGFSLGRRIHKTSEHSQRLRTLSTPTATDKTKTKPTAKEKPHSPQWTRWTQWPQCTDSLWGGAYTKLRNIVNGLEPYLHQQPRIKPKQNPRPRENPKPPFDALRLLRAFRHNGYPMDSMVYRVKIFFGWRTHTNFGT